MTDRFTLVLNLLILAALSVYVLWPVSPINMPYDGRDSGVFLYAGWRILNGEVPYRDVWDHKPPMIFFLNALGLWITPDSRWGVWGLELVSLLLAALLSYLVMQRSMGETPALIGTALWMMAMVPCFRAGGNWTTEYTLPLQFAVLWLLPIPFSRLAWWRWLGIGFLGGVAFFTKQTAIGIWLTIFVLFTFQSLHDRNVKEWASAWFAVLVGFLLVVFAWVAYFGFHHSLSFFWDAAFRYNFAYSRQKADIASRLDAITNGVAPLAQNGLFQLAGLGLLILFWNWRKSPTPWLILVAALDFPIELGLIGISGRKYPHYYLTLLPALGLLAAYFFTNFQDVFVKKSQRIARIYLAFGALFVFLWSFQGSYRGYLSTLHGYYQERTEALRELRTFAETRPILMWGAETFVNYYLRTPSPTRFVYQYPLYTPGYTREELILEFLDALLSNPPAVIVDTHNPLTPFLKFPIQSTAIEERLGKVRCLYRPYKEFGDWDFYIYHPEGCAP